MNLNKMRDELKAWIESDCGDDIIASPFQRSDYSPFVVVAFLRKVEREDIPTHVLKQIEQQIEDSKKVTPIRSRISFWMRLFQGFKKVK